MRVLVNRSPPRDIVREIELQDDAIALEAGRKRREHLGGADAGYGRAVQRFGSGTRSDYQFRDGAVARDRELNRDAALASQPRAFRQDGQPIAPHGGEDLNEIRAEVDALGIAQQLQLTGFDAGRWRKVDAFADPAGAAEIDIAHREPAPRSAAHRLPDGFGNGRIRDRHLAASGRQGLRRRRHILEGDFGFLDRLNLRRGGRNWRQVRTRQTGFQFGRLGERRGLRRRGGRHRRRPRRLRPRGRRRGRRNLNPRPRLNVRQFEFFGDLARIGRFLGQLRRRLDQRCDNAFHFRDALRLESRGGNQHQNDDERDVRHYRQDGRPSPSGRV